MPSPEVLSKPHVRDDLCPHLLNLLGRPKYRTEQLGPSDSNTGVFLARRGFSATPAYIPETRRDTRLMKLVLKPLHVLATANAIDYQEDISSRT